MLKQFENSSVATIPDLVSSQRDYWNTKETLSYQFRKASLEKLSCAISNNTDQIIDALKSDFNKCEFETYISEISFVQKEIEHTIKKLKKWMRPNRVSSPLVQLPCISYIYKQPYGTVLIIGPWNYPLQLVLSPLVGAIAAGNTAILKPSELAPETAKVVEKIIKEAFDSKFVSVVNGGIKETTELLEEKFDYIFYTGSTEVGKIIMNKASKYLTPVTLELGGKSPCIVTNDIDLEITARRIVWGKFLNAGQTCVAPDYILVEPSIKGKLVAMLKEKIVEFYGESPINSPDFPRIINSRHFDRISNLLKGLNILHGGEVDRENNFISPTVVEAKESDDVMGSEIFGPILPIIESKNIDESINFINKRPKPLALYLFSRNKDYQNMVLERTSSGGVCLNDTVVHLTNPAMPFGGIGDSGMGAYHGKYSFDVFSHEKSVMKRFFLLDLLIKYPPYLGKLKIIKVLLKYLS